MSAPNGVTSDRIVLLLRSPKINDGCKVTLTTLYKYHQQFGVFPTLAELARIRGVTVMTIRNHFDEAKAAHLLEVQRQNGGFNIAFNWNELAKTLGFGREKEASSKVALKMALPKGSELEEIKARVQKPTNHRDALTYFAAVYREKFDEPYKRHRADANRIRLLVKNLGVETVTEMMDFFATHRGRLMLGGFNIETLFTKQDKILESMERKR